MLGFSAVVVLALGIGASTFALAMLLAFSSLTPPGIKNADYATIAEETEGGGSVPISWRSFQDLAHESEPDVRIVAYSGPIKTTLVDSNGQTNPLTVAAISKTFFSVFTSHLTAGSDFDADEEARTGQHVVIIGFPLALRLFGAPQLALNQSLLLAGTAYQIIGVAPANFGGLFGDSVEAWVPASSVIPLELQLPPQFAKLAGPNAWQNLATFYGLAMSTRLSSARLAATLRQSLPLHQIGKASMHVSQGLTTDPVRDATLRKWLRLSLLLAAIFTIISCLNFSLLLLARTPGQSDEVVLKRALGAGTGRLATELMIGPAAIMGTAILLASALWIGGLKWVAGISPFYEQLVRGSWRDALLAFSIQLPVVCALTLFIALIPAIHLLRDSTSPHLGYAATTTRRTGVFLQALVTSQVTLCIATWILGGMVTGAVISTMREGLGYDPSHLAVIDVGIRPGIPVTISSMHDTFPPHGIIETLVRGLAAIPGVRSAAFADAAPFDSPMTTTTIERMTGAGAATPRTVNITDVSPGYFHTMAARLLRGNEFTWDDVAARASKVIVNQALAKELWPDENPVGASVRLSRFYPSTGYSSSSAALVVGVVDNMRFSGYAESPQPTIFECLHAGYGGFALIVNGTEPLHSLQGTVHKEVAALLPQLGIDQAYSIADRAQASRWQIEKRAYFALAGALLMALIAYIGLYGALAFYVNSRRRELAVRVCLGAQPWQIRKLIFLRAARCAAFAAVISVPLWPILAQLSSSDYLGSVSWSTGRAILLALACVIIAILVSVVPARSAVRTSPAEVLKEL